MNNGDSGPVVRVVAWLVIATCLVEWFPFFLQVLLNFFNMNLRSMPAGELPMILAFVASPLISLLLCAVGSKVPALAKKVMLVTAMVLLGIVAAMAWLTYAAYYQLYPAFSPDFMGHVTPNSDMFGYLGYMNLAPKLMVYATNAIVFFGLVPALYHVASGGEGGRVVVNGETRLGLLFAAVYMCLRPGSIVGVPFRLSLVCLGALTACLLAIVIAGKPGTGPAPKPGDIVAAAIPKWAMAGVAMLVAFPFLAPAGMANALMDATWVWAFLAAGLVVSDVLARRGIIPSNPRVAVAFIVTMITVQVLVLLATVEPVLISMHSWLQASSLFLLGSFPAVAAPLLQRTRPNKFLVHPARQWWFFMTGVLASLVPLLSGLLPPVTTWAALVLACATSVLGLLAMLVAHRRDASRVDAPPPCAA